MAGAALKQPLQFEIWGRLDFIGLDAEGNIHIIIRKRKDKINGYLIKKVRNLHGRKIRITMKECY